MAVPIRDKTQQEPLTGARILLVEGRFYDHINDELVAGAREAVERAGGTVDIVTVPGCLEVPIAISMALDAADADRAPYDGVVALGCVIRGETTHYEIVSNESARALMLLGITRNLALGNGIITVENEAQALARAKRSEMNKGRDAALACLALVRLKKKLNERRGRRAGFVA